MTAALQETAEILKSGRQLNGFFEFMNKSGDWSKDWPQEVYGFRFIMDRPTMNVKGVDVPIFDTEYPKKGQIYYALNQSNCNGYTACAWSGHHIDLKAFDRGIFTEKAYIEAYVAALWGE